MISIAGLYPQDVFPPERTNYFHTRKRIVVCQLGTDVKPRTGFKVQVRTG